MAHLGRRQPFAPHLPRLLPSGIAARGVILTSAARASALARARLPGRLILPKALPVAIAPRPIIVSAALDAPKRRRFAGRALLSRLYVFELPVTPPFGGNVVYITFSATPPAVTFDLAATDMTFDETPPGITHN